eukprot:817729-Pyramimonas_sp.AAC.2
MGRDVAPPPKPPPPLVASGRLRRVVPSVFIVLPRSRQSPILHGTCICMQVPGSGGPRQRAGSVQGNPAARQTQPSSLEQDRIPK